MIRRSSRSSSARRSDEFFFFGDAELVRRSAAQLLKPDEDREEEEEVFFAELPPLSRQHQQEQQPQQNEEDEEEEEEDEEEEEESFSVAKKKHRKFAAATTTEPTAEADTSYEGFRHRALERNRQMLLALRVTEGLSSAPSPKAVSPQRRPYKKRQKLLPPDLRRSFRIKGLQPDGGQLLDEEAHQQQQQQQQSQRQPETIATTLRISDALRPPPAKGGRECAPVSLVEDLLASLSEHQSARPEEEETDVADAAAAAAATAAPRIATRRTSQARALEATARRDRDTVLERLEALSVQGKDGDEDEGCVRRVAWDRVSSLAVLNRHDADVVAAGSSKGDICVWHVTAERSVTFNAHSGHRPVSGLAWTNAGEALFSVGLDGAMRRLSIESGVSDAVLRTTPSVPDGRKAGQRFGLSGLALDASGHVAYTGALNGCIIAVDDRVSNNPVSAVCVHTGRVCTFQLHPLDEDIAVTSSADGCAAIWDLRVLLGRVRHQQSLAEMSVGAGERVRRARDARGCIAAFEHPRALTSAVVSQHGQHPLLTTCADNTVRMWQAPFKTAASARKSKDDLVSACADLEWHHESRTGPLITPLQAAWSPHHAGIAAVGCVNRRLRILGEWPSPACARVDMSISDPLLTAPPSLNVWHPAREFVLVSATAECLAFWH